MTYREKLKRPEWQKKRLEIMGRDNFCCRKCDNPKKSQLHVHHIIYQNNRDPWEYNNSELITLCSECHKQEHDNIRSVNNSISSIVISCDYDTKFVSSIIIMIARCIAFSKKEWIYNFLNSLQTKIENEDYKGLKGGDKHGC